MTTIGTRGDRPHAVVTGGAGFLGSHLVDSLLDDGYRVTSLDNFGSGREANLAHVDTTRFESRHHDVRKPFPAFDRVDCVYHFASRASPADFEAHAIGIATTNMLGTQHALETAHDHEARLVLASTSEVYGDPSVHPQHEEYNGNVSVRGLRAPYDESKRVAEALGGAYHRRHGVDVRTVRIFNTYGPRMREDDGRVIPTFIRQALDGEPLTVYGDGSQTRSFCYVSDLVAGVRALAEAEAGLAAGAVVNVGSESEVTVRHLAETVIDVLDADSEIVYRDLPENDPQRRRPDLTRAERLLGWQPTVDLRSGLTRTMRSFRTTTKA